MGSFGKILKRGFDIFSGREFMTRTGILPGDGGRPGWDYESPDPYTSNVQWDATGRPIGRMPKGKYALDYQYEADRRTQERRNALWSDAHGALNQGRGLLESYRPGGAAALASGIYGQQAGLYAQESMALQSPDLLMGYREHKQEEADYERRKAQENAQFMSLIGAGVGLLGLGAAGGGAAAAMGAGEAGSYVGNRGGVQSYQGDGMGYLGQQRGGQTMYGPGWGNTPYQGGQTFQAVIGDQGQQAGGGPQIDSPQTGGGFGGGGGYQTGGGFGGEQRQSVSQGIVSGGQPMTTFRSGEAASMAMAQSPSDADVYSRWRQDESRQEFTYLMMQSAASRVMQAMRA